MKHFSSNLILWVLCRKLVGELRSSAYPPDHCPFSLFHFNWSCTHSEGGFVFKRIIPVHLSKKKKEILAVRRCPSVPLLLQRYGSSLTWPPPRHVSSAVQAGGCTAAPAKPKPQLLLLSRAFENKACRCVCRAGALSWPCWLGWQTWELVVFLFILKHTDPQPLFHVLVLYSSAISHCVS